MSSNVTVLADPHYTPPGVRPHLFPPLPFPRGFPGRWRPHSQPKGSTPTAAADGAEVAR